MAARYQVNTNAAISITANDPTTIMNIINGANALVRLIELSVSFDGVSASETPALIELCSSTQATAGTSTSHTIQQIGGPTRTAEATAQRAYTVEPTVLTVIQEWYLSPNGGVLHIQAPLGREIEQTTTADGLCLRVTTPAAAATVNVRGFMNWEEG